MEKKVIELEEKNRIVTVCNECHCASCWHGIFYCQRARNAGTQDLPVSSLNALAMENPWYYSFEECMKTCGSVRFRHDEFDVVIYG